MDSYQRNALALRFEGREHQGETELGEEGREKFCISNGVAVWVTTFTLGIGGIE